MSLKIVSQGSDRGSPYNEDMIGAGAAGVWLLDGATGLAPSRFDGSSDAQWLVRAFSDYFRHAEGETQAVLRSAIAAVRAAYVATGPLPAQPYAMPSAGLALVRDHGEAIEIATLADVKAYVQFRDGRQVVLGGGPLEALDAALIEALKAAQAAQGFMDLKALRTQFEPLIRANRERMNRPDGYWVLSLEAVCLTGLEVRRFQRSEIDTVLLATDGFYDLWERYEPGSFAQVLAELKAGRGEAVVARLRAIERADERGERFARVKLHDDASWVWLEL